MKRVHINQGTVGILTKKGDYVGVLESGTHWIGWNQRVQICNMAVQFHSTMKEEILLADNKLSSMLDIIEIGDTELGFLYNGKNFEKLMQPGKHMYWKTMNDYRFEVIDRKERELPNTDKWKQLLQRIPSTMYKRFSVAPYQKGLLIIDGKFDRLLDSGVYTFWNMTTAIEVVGADLRKIDLEISGQEMLTKDKAAIRMNFQAQYKITDVIKAHLDNKTFEKQLYTQFQLALRAYIGTMTLDELLANKETVAPYIQKAIAPIAADLGVAVYNCGIKDIILPGDIREIMNQVLVAQKKAQANVIMRREETASTRSLLNTAKLMEDNTMLYKLKEMEYVEKIAEKIQTISVSGGGQLVDQLKGIFSP